MKESLENLLKVILDDGGRQMIISDAIKHMTDVSSEIRKYLEKNLKRCIKIDGFRDLLKVPQEILINKIIASNGRYEDLEKSLLLVWLESHAKLRLTTEQLVKQYEETLQLLEDKTDPDYHEKIDNILTEITFKLINEHACSEKEARIMTLLIAKDVLDPLQDVNKIDNADEPYEKEALDCLDEDEKVDFNHWLSLLEKIPASSDLWSKTDDFANSLIELTERKVKEHTNVNDIIEVLEGLKEQCSKELAYHELLSANAWSIEKLNITQFENIVAEVLSFEQLLKERAELMSKPVENMKEERQRRNILDEIDKKIESKFKLLDSQLTPLEPKTNLTKTEAQISKKESSRKQRVNDKAEDTINLRPLHTDEEPEKMKLPILQNNNNVIVQINKDIMVDVTIQPDAANEESYNRNSNSNSNINIYDKSAEIPKIEEELSQESTGYASIIWKMLQQKEIAAAYWLSREYEDQDKEEDSTVLPSWMLLASWMAGRDSWDHPEIINRMLNICYDHSQPATELLSITDNSEYAFACWLAAAAAPAALQAPSTMAISWLDEALTLLKNHDTNLYILIEEIRNYVASGKPLNRGYLQEALATKDWLDQSRQAFMHIKDWRDTAKNRRIEYAPALEVCKHFAGNQSPIKDVFDIIESSSYTQADVVRSLIDNHLSNRKSIQNLIDSSAFNIYSSSSVRPQIHGHALEQLIRSVEELRTYLLDWCISAQYSLVGQDNNNWLRQQTEQLVQSLNDLWPATSREMDEISSDSKNNHRMKKRILINLSKYLLGNFMAYILGYESYIPCANKWEEDLMFPLFKLRNSPINDTGTIDIDEVFSPQESLLKILEEERTFDQAIDIHTETKDLLLINLIYQWCDYHGITLNKEQEVFTQTTTEWQRVTNRQLEVVRTQLEQARIDHVVSEEDYSVFLGNLLSIINSGSQRFGNVSNLLYEMTQQLQDLRSDRISSLGAIIKEIQLGLDNADGPLSSSDQNRQAIDYLKKAKTYLFQGDLPLADEYIRFAELVIETGQDVEIDAMNPVLAVTEFVQVIPSLSAYLENNERTPNITRTQLEKGKSFGGLDLTIVRKKQREEAVYSLDSWRQLKRFNLNNKELIEKQLPPVLQYMGFHQPLLEKIAEDISSVHYRATMSASSSCPLPEFGSQAGGIYDVVVISDRPTIGKIEHMLATYGLKGRNPILIYLGRFTMMQRQEWSSFCYKEKLTALLVDELLLYYLASQRDDRLPAAVSCGIAWGYAVPYRSFGVIPPELFKGRREMINQLGIAGGSCIVYGGRQLGKSVLLRSVQYKYHKPEQDMYVLYEDIRNLGDPQSIQDNDKSKVWWLLRQQLILNKLLPNKCSDDAENIMTELISSMKDHPNRKIIFLLDEADKFLNADAITNFEDINYLRRLMDQTDRRFKVVFCGLHGVQRYCSGENHPFAQMMDKPVVVGPLEPLSARMLIEQPMSAVGFNFETEDSYNAVLRILSYTNYHPALIQLFCAEIIKLVRKKKHEPPYRISMSDVEAIYQYDGVRKVMNERFQWTLALDARYETIVYSMIEEQYQERDGFRKEFSASQLLEHCRFWWPEGFASLPLEEMRALLDELIGLGILVKRGNGQYRLRNANVVRALGSEKVIEEKLLQISGLRPIASNEHNSNLRIELNSENGIRSPLTIRQANELTGFKSGVGMVFGNSALGLDLVPNTLKSIFHSKQSSSVKGCQIIELPPEKINSKQILDYFERYLKRENSNERIVVYNYMSRINIKDASLSDLVNEVSYMLTKKGKRTTNIRWILLIDADCTREWLLDDASVNSENNIEAVCRLTHWDNKNVRNFLASREMLDSDEVARYILETTGGWPYLLQKMWDLKDKSSLFDARSLADRIRTLLYEKDSKLCESFVNSLGIGRVPGGLELLNMINEIDEIKSYEIFDISRISENQVLLSMNEGELQATAGTLIRSGLLKESMKGLYAEPIALRAVAKCHT